MTREEAKDRANWKLWYLANKERVREQEARRYRTNEEYREAAKARSRAWHHANKDRAKEQKREWRKANRTMKNAKNRGRNAVKRRAPGEGVTGRQWEQILADSLGICAYCNNREPLTMDHIEPLQKGGEHDVGNIVAACGSCNSSKGAKTLIIWLAQKRAA